MLSLADESELLDRGSDDPTFWVENVLGCEPWRMQCSILDAMRTRDRVAVASCHGAGKSWLASRIALWFLYNHCPSVVITTAPTDRQVRGILWKEIGRAHRDATYRLGGKVLSNKIALDIDWYAWGFTAPDYDPDRFQGFHEENILIIVDEASGVSAAIFDGIDGILSSANAKLLQIGNPTDPQGYFADSFTRKSTAQFHISAFDTPNFTAYGITLEDIASGEWLQKVTGPLPAPWLVTPEWVRDKFERWGVNTPWWQSRVLGQFPSESEDTLIPMAWVEAARLRELKPEGRNTLGVDVARTGSDESTCYHAHGPVVRQVFAKQGLMINETAGRVRQAAARTLARPAFVDIIGLGAGVHDILAEDDPSSVEEVNFAAAAYDTERFANLKAELYWRVRERFESGTIDIDPEDEELAVQASSVRWGIDSKGRVIIESKEEMAKRGVRSPDRFEALVYAYAGAPTAIEGTIDIGSPTRNRPWDV